MPSQPETQADVADGGDNNAGGHGLLGWAGQVVAWTVILAVAALLMISLIIPKLAGATPYTILTGSMRPSLPPGTLVVVRPVDAHRIGVGDVITYQLRSGNPTVVTHRVVAQGLDRDGNPVFQLQGDTNNTPDQAWVKPVQVKGKVWYSVPYLGYATNFVTKWQRHLLTLVIAGGLLAYSTYMFAGAARSRRSRRGQVQA